MTDRPRAVVRTSRVADVAAFAAVERSAAALFLGTDRAWIASEEPTETEAHRAAIAAGHHWTAMIEGEVAGFLLAQRFGDTLHVAELVVAAAHQRNGLGSKLLAAAESYAIAAAFGALSLTTYRDLAWNAPFYRRRGFRILAPAEVPRHLAAQLAAEAREGHDPALRCAMMKRLR